MRLVFNYSLNCKSLFNECENERGENSLRPDLKITSEEETYTVQGFFKKLH